MALGIWNNLDELALYLGISRLDGETNDELAERLKIFPRWKYKTDYYSQVHSIPIQLGLNTEVVGRIVNINNNNFICNIEWDYLTLYEDLGNGNIGEYIRIFLEGKDSTLQDVVNVISNSNSFKLNIYNNSDLTTKLSFLVRNRNTRVNTETIQGQYSYLLNKNIVNSSLRVNDKSYRKAVASIDMLTRPGDYFIDYENGFIQTFDNTPSQTSITYRYYDTTFAIEKTELNLIPVNRIFAYGATDEAINILPYLLNNIVAGV